MLGVQTINFKRSFSGLIAAVFISLQLPLMLLFPLTASALGEECNEQNKTNINHECYWEDRGHGECTKIDNLNQQTYTLDPAPTGYTYSLLVVKSSDYNDEYLNPTAGIAYSGHEVLGNDGNPKNPPETHNISHIIYCLKPTVSTPETGSLTIIKDADPNDPISFGFTSNVTGHGSFSLVDNPGQAGHNDDESMSGLALDTAYTVTESETAGWTLADIDCGNANVTENLAARTVTVTLTSNQKDVTCTFENTKDEEEEKGSLTIIKDARPNSTTEFDFTSNVTGHGSFALVDNPGQAGHNNDESMSNLTLDAAYTVTEAATPGWTLDEIDCGDANVTINNNSVSVTLTSNQKDVTCTFINEENPPVETGSLTIIKDAQPNSAFLFGFTSNVNGHGSFALVDSPDFSGHNNDETMNGLALDNTYTVTEQAANGWTLSSIDCGNATVTKNGSSVSVTLTSSQKDVTCTFVNTQNETINGGRGGGEDILKIITVAKPITAKTVTNNDAAELADTGSDVLLNLFVGLALIGITAGATRINQRRLV